MTRRSLEFQLMGYTLTKAQRRTLKKKGRNMGKKEIALLEWCKGLRTSKELPAPASRKISALSGGDLKMFSFGFLGSARSA